MNSKNLSKAINRVLAILLTAAMVAGSFTVPAKADVAEDELIMTESMVDEGYEDSDDGYAADAEEASEDVEEEPLMVEEIIEEGEIDADESAASEGYTIKKNTTAIAALTKTFDNTSTSVTTIKGYYHVYKGNMEDPTLTTALQSNIAITYKDDDGSWKTESSSVVNAHEYKIYAYVPVTLEDGTQEELEVNDTFTISKVSIDGWKGTYSATTAYKYQADSAKADGTVEAKQITAEAFPATAFSYTAPTTNPTDMQTLFASDTYDQAISLAETGRNATGVFTAGTGRNNLYNATVSDPEKGGKDKPTVTVTLANNFPNFSGSFTVPFEIGAKTTPSTGDFDTSPASNITEEILFDTTAATGNKGEIDLGSIVKDPDLKVLVDGKAVSPFISSEIKSAEVVVSDNTEATALKAFFPTRLGNLSDGTATNDFPKIDIIGTTLKYETLKYDSITAPNKEVTINVKISFNNYKNTETVPIKFTAINDKTTDGDVAILQSGGGAFAADTVLNIPYTGKPAEVEVKIKDAVSGNEVNFANATIGGVKAYFYKGQGTNKEFIKAVNYDNTKLSDTGTGGYAKYTAVAPTPGTDDTWNLAEVGEYTVVLVYTGVTASTTRTAKQTVNYKVVKDTTTGKSIDITRVANTNLDRVVADADKLPLITAGTAYVDKDLTVKIDDAVLVEGVDYVITPGNAVSNTAKWDYATALETVNKELTEKGVTKLADIDALYTKAKDPDYAKYFVEGKEAIYFDNNGDAKTDKPVILWNQPYVKIELKENNPHFAVNVADPVYIKYQIEDSRAVLDTTFKSAYTVDITKSAAGLSIPLAGAYKVGGATLEPTSYTVTSNISPNSGSATVTGISSETTPADGLVFTLSKNLAKGDAITFTLVPTFAGNVKKESDLRITVTCVDEISLVTSVKSAYTDYSDGKVEYKAATALAAGNLDVKVMRGTTDVTTTYSSDYETKVYQLASETKNPDALDQVPPTADTKTNRYEYDVDGDGKKELYTLKDATLDGDGKITAVNTAIDPKDIGHYLAVTSLKAATKAAGAQADDAVIPFEVVKKNLTNKNARLALANSGTVVYLSTQYKGVVEANPTLNNILLPARVYTGTTGTTAMPGLADTDFDIAVGSIEKTGTKTSPTYRIPVSIACKETSKHFTGSVSGYITVTQAELVKTNFTINYYTPNLTYTGEVQHPVLKNITYKNVPYKTIEEVIAAIDSQWLEAELKWPESKDVEDPASSYKATIELGGLYKWSSAGAPESAAYAIKKAANTDIADVVMNVVIPAASNAVSSKEVGILPLEFASKTAGKEAYKVIASAPYGADGTVSPAAIVEKDADGKELSANTLPTLTVTLAEGNILKLAAGANTDAKIGCSYEFEIPVKFTNYADKKVKIVATIKADGSDTTLTPTTSGGFDSTTSSDGTGVVFNGQDAEQRIAALSDTNTFKVTQAGKPAVRIDKAMIAGGLTEGKIKMSWYKSSAYNGTYSACELEDTKNVGYYKALVTLEGGNEYYMTPTWTGVLKVTQMTKNATKNATLVADDIKGVTVDSVGYIYNGKKQEPKLTITLVEGALIKADDTVTPAIAASPEYTLVQDKDFNINFTNSTDGTKAGNQEFEISDTNSNIALATLINGDTSLLAAADKKYKIAKADLEINLKDISIPLKSDGSVVPAFKDVKDTVVGLMENQYLNDAAVVINAKDENNKAVALGNICKKAGKYTITVDDAFAKNTVVDNPDSIGSDYTANYKLASNSKTATITVEAPKTITPAYTVKVGDKVLTKQTGDIVYFDDKTKAVDVELKDGATAIDKDEFEVEITKDNKPAVVKEVGDYKVTVTCKSDLYTFDSIEVTFKVEKEKITPTAAIKVGGTEIKNGRTAVYKDSAPLALEVGLKNGEEVVNVDDYDVTIAKDAGAASSTIPATVAAEKATYVLKFTAKETAVKVFDELTFTFKVDDKPGRQVQTIAFDTSSTLRVKYNDPKMETSEAQLLVKFDLADETVSAADIDYSPKLVGSRIVVTPKDNGFVSFTSTGYGYGTENDTIEYTFWVDDDETKTAKIKVRNMPENATPTPTPGTDNEYTKQDDEDKRVSIAGATVTGIKSYTYKGESVEPAPTVKLGNKKLKLGQDYRIYYDEAPVAAGTYDIHIVGINDYKDEVVNDKGKCYTFDIKPVDIKGSAVKVTAGTITKDSTGKLDYDTLSYAVFYKTMTLDAGEDFVIDEETEPSTDKSGKNLTFRIKGQVNYQGYKDIKVKIVDKGKKTGVIKNGDAEFTAEAAAATYVFDGKTKHQPAVEVTVDGTKLGSKDYKVTYKNNVNAGIAQAVVTGKGNYVGTAVLTFNIEQASAVMDDGGWATIKNNTPKFNGKLQKPAVTVTSKVTNKTLKKNRDYVVYYYNNLNVGENTAHAQIIGIGNYAGQETEVTFSIKQIEFKGSPSKKVFGSNTEKKYGVFYNGKALVAGKDFTAKCDYTKDKKDKYTIYINAVEDDPTCNFSKAKKDKKITAVAANIDWTYLGLDAPTE